MSKLKYCICALSVCFVMIGAASAAKNDVLSELRFKAATRVEKSAGVWIDGQYLGFLKELKRSKKVLLLPGSHDVIIKRVGYDDFKTQVSLEPGQVSRLTVAMIESSSAQYPTETARVRINVEPNRAAVFVDEQYVGYVDRFDGRNQGLLVAPGKRTFKVTLPGYQTFETEMNLNASQDYEISTRLQKGSIKEADALIDVLKSPDAQPLADASE